MVDSTIRFEVNGAVRGRCLSALLCFQQTTHGSYPLITDEALAHESDPVGDEGVRLCLQNGEFVIVVGAASTALPRLF